jgi:hypothetical protein
MNTFQTSKETDNKENSMKQIEVRKGEKWIKIQY